ncbi:MAG: bifunctional phosphoglucose/phosphomannose isomerase [Chloroflexi bacterium]|nr:bifunctional phosphoglucose/phosphomannose isomerase [Chloroflexota bacterium]
MTILDDRATYERLDPAGIGGLIAGLPGQFWPAWNLGLNARLPEGAAAATRIAVAAMGGSAIGGALVRGLAERESRTPIAVCRDYRLPAWADRRTLVVAASFSGNTEETLSCFEQALEIGAPSLAITTGGRLTQLAAAHWVPAVSYSYDGMPRCALGFGFGALLGALEQIGVFSGKGPELAAALAIMEGMSAELGPDAPAESNLAKQMATRLHGKIPVVYGAGFLSDAATRWKGQFNENSKNWAFYEALPEANHNAVEGYDYPADLADRMAVVFLRSPLLAPRVLDRIGITADILTRQGVANAIVDGRGDTALSHLLTAVYFGDWVSYYLAMLNGADPNPIPQIDYLKDQLSRR